MFSNFPRNDPGEGFSQIDRQKDIDKIKESMRNSISKREAAEISVNICEEILLQW